jgi:hypothetical protein
MPPINFGIGLSLSSTLQISKFGITGSAYPGSTLIAKDLSGLLLLMDDGELLVDDGDQLARGTEEGYYQWYINGVAVFGANDYIFVIPDTVNNGDLIRVNDSFTVRVQPLPFAVISASYTSSPRVISSTSDPTTVTVTDREVSRIINATTASDYNFFSTLQGTTNGEYWSFVSSNPAAATVNPSNGNVTYQSAGSTTVTASLRDEVRTFNLTTSLSGGQTVDTFIGYATGSVAKNATDAVDSRIASKYNPSVNLNVYTTQEHENSIYVRNPNLWCADIDLTCISPWNSSGTTSKACTLISPRHVIMAAHWAASAGATVRFIAANGTVVNRTLTATRRHPSYTPYYPDITIGLLDRDVPSTINDSDVPSTIKFAKVLGANWASYLPSLANTTARIPAIGLDQQEKATVRDLYSYTTAASFRQPTGEKRAALYETIVEGDSGAPAFIIVNNELVLLTVWTHGGEGSGTAITPQISEINSMMTALGGGYTLTTVDLSGFNSYV